MTILAELLRNKTYGLPEKFFDLKGGYSISFTSDEQRQGGYVRIHDKARNLVEQISLPEHYLEDMLCEYLVGCFETLRSGKGSLLDIHNELTSVDRSLYTVKDEPSNEQNNNIDRPQLTGNAFTMPQGWLVEQALARPERRQAETPTREQLYRFDGTRWIATGIRRHIPDNRARTTLGDPIANAGQDLQQPGALEQVDAITYGDIWRNPRPPNRGA